MAKNKKDNEVLTLTFKGLMWGSVGNDADRVLDAIELYMRRNNYNAIVLDDGFHLTHVERVAGK
jgi:hypothetical protein